jgi:hypothetical protein
MLTHVAQTSGGHKATPKSVKRPPHTPCSGVTTSPVSVQNTAPSAWIRAIRVPEVAHHIQQPCSHAHTFRIDLWGTQGHPQERETGPTHTTLRDHHLTCFRSEHRPIGLDSRYSSPRSRPSHPTTMEPCSHMSRRPLGDMRLPQERETPPPHTMLRGHHPTCFRSEHGPIGLDSRHLSPRSRPSHPTTMQPCSHMSHRPLGDMRPPPRA